MSTDDITNKFVHVHGNCRIILKLLGLFFIRFKIF